MKKLGKQLRGCSNSSTLSYFFLKRITVLYRDSILCSAIWNTLKRTFRKITSLISHSLYKSNSTHQFTWKKSTNKTGRPCYMKEFAFKWGHTIHYGGGEAESSKQQKTFSSPRVTMKTSGDRDRRWGTESEGKGEKKKQTKSHIKKKKVTNTKTVSTKTLP